MIVNIFSNHTSFHRSKKMSTCPDKVFIFRAFSANHHLLPLYQTNYFSNFDVLIKFFFFAYSVKISEEKKSTVCEDKEMSLSCPGSSKIVVSYAMYGRKTTNICWKIHSFIWSTTCAATNSLSIIKDKCQGKTSCQISASNGMFGDPCRFTEKYLDVTYRCLG